MITHGLRGSLLALALGLSGCVSLASYGEPAAGFVSPAVGQAFIPLRESSYLVLMDRGAAVVIAPGVAVTNAHNANLVDPSRVLATSQEYDLLFFRVDRAKSLASAVPQAGERVIAYAQGRSGELRQAEGTIHRLDAPVRPRCGDCGVQHAFTFQADGGPGFSGGPVVDLQSGTLVGIVFGYRDIDGERYMYAYNLTLVEAHQPAGVQSGLQARSR